MRDAFAGLLEAQGERLSVLAVEEAKGLEYDAVVVVAPEEITSGSTRGGTISTSR